MAETMIQDKYEILFDTSYYASSLQQKLKRAIELGPKYYFYDLPRYFKFRHELDIPMLDIGILINPLREFTGRVYHQGVLPDGYEEALNRCRDVGITFALPRPRLEALLAMWWETRTLPGVAIEFGSYKGATFLLLALLAKMNGIEQSFLLLDTFEGLPIPAHYDLGRKSEEQFHLSENQAEIISHQAENLNIRNKIEIYKGLFSETIKRLETIDIQLAFVHIDANIYESTMEACEFAIPRVQTDGILVFDDYNALVDLGARLAIDRYLYRNLSSTKPKPLVTCSAYIKL